MNRMKSPSPPLLSSDPDHCVYYAFPVLSGLGLSPVHQHSQDRHDYCRCRLNKGGVCRRIESCAFDKFDTWKNISKLQFASFHAKQ